MYELTEIRVSKANTRWLSDGLGHKINFIFTNSAGEKESRTVYSNIDPCYKTIECLACIAFRRKKPKSIVCKVYSNEYHYYSITKYIFKASEVK